MSYQLADLLKRPSDVDALLTSLDLAARTDDPYEYGLPLHSDAYKAQMREIVYRWIAEHVTP